MILILLYDYQKSRAGKHAKNFLNGFNGFLQTDGYAAYNKIDNTISAGCLAHSRRKYTDALKTLPKDADLSGTKINQAIEYFSKIYKLEKELHSKLLEYR